jgi:hypothetical protein
MRRAFIFVTAALGMFGLLGASCVNPVDDNPNGGTTGADTTHFPRIAVTTAASDFSSANLEIVSAGGRPFHQNLLAQLHTDHSIRAPKWENAVYILERFGRDNVIKYDAKNLTPVYQENIGTGLNLQDIAVVSETKAYISCHLSSELIVFDPQAGKKISSIDLSRFNSYVGTDSAEASPFASALEVGGNYVYVACQRLKTVQEVWGTNIVAGDTSVIAIIDTRSNVIIGSIALNKKNPASMSVFQGKMLVSSTGDWYDAATGGVEMIDLAANVNLGIVVEGNLFGGSISDIIYVSSNKAFICVGKMSDDFSNFWTEVIPFDPATGSVGAKITGVGNGFGGIA